MKEKDRQNIYGVREHIDKSRFKAYLLLELFTSLATYEGREGPIEDYVLFSRSLKTILKEIVDGLTEATDTLTYEIT